MGDPRAIRPLLRSLDGKTYELTAGEGTPGQYSMITCSAAQALGRINTRASVSGLLSRLKKDDCGSAAAYGLRYTRDSRVSPALIKALGSPSDSLRCSAANSLGHVGDQQAVRPLIQALRDPIWTVQVAAAKTLGTIGDVTAMEILQTLFLDPSTYISPRLPTFQDDDVRIHLRSKAARGMALIGTAHGLELLKKSLESDEQETRLIAAVGLTYRKDASVWQVIAEIPRRKKNALITEVVEALGHCGDPKGVPILEAIESSRKTISVQVCELARQTLKSMQIKISES